MCCYCAFLFALTSRRHLPLVEGHKSFQIHGKNPFPQCLWSIACICSSKAILWGWMWCTSLFALRQLIFSLQRERALSCFSFTFGGTLLFTLQLHFNTLGRYKWAWTHTHTHTQYTHTDTQTDRDYEQWLANTQAFIPLCSWWLCDVFVWLIISNFFPNNSGDWHWRWINVSAMCT